MVTIINVIWVREIAAGFFALALDFDYSVRVFYRIRAQEEVEAGKERGVDANTKTKSDDGNQRESRVLKQHSHAVAQILPKVRHDIISSSDTNSHDCRFSDDQRMDGSIYPSGPNEQR